MSEQAARRKQYLFVDDDAGFLTGMTELFSAMAKGSWEVHTAQNHAQALEILRHQRIDVVVVDLDMPVMDGLQFLRLLTRTHPGQQAVILTGHSSEPARQQALDSGAVLFLEKVTTPDGFAAVFAALDALAGGIPQEGFRGVMRRVGLQEVLQMECLSRKSSILEIFTGKVKGRIFISDGAMVHAESGGLQGEVALYGLLALRGGEFNFLPYHEPPRRTIAGQWESLLMEAARLSDEGAQFLEAKDLESPAPAGASDTAVSPQEPTTAPALNVAAPIRTKEIVLCSGGGEVLYQWECNSVEPRLKLMAEVEEQGKQLGSRVRAGMFDRLELHTSEERVVCQVQPHRRLFVRAAGHRGEPG
jgi:CheY-like chemotaxis protein